MQFVEQKIVEVQILCAQFQLANCKFRCDFDSRPYGKGIVFSGRPSVRPLSVVLKF